MDINNFLSKKNREKFLEFILEIFDNANRKIILPSYQNLKSNDINYKIEKNDLVTLVDIKTEEFISKSLSKKFSNISIIGEENTFSNPKSTKKINHELFFTIDPIDGTNNYVKGNDKFCSMISLVYKKIPIASFIFFPISNELIYSFWRCGVFYRNIYNNCFKKIIIRSENDLFVGTGNTKGIPALNRNQILDRLKKHTKRNFIGSAGVETYQMMFNKVNFILHGRVTPWDHYPLDLIIRESGGSVHMLRDKTKFQLGSHGPLLAISDKNNWNKLRDFILPIDDSYRLK